MNINKGPHTNINIQYKITNIIIIITNIDLHIYLELQHTSPPEHPDVGEVALHRDAFHRGSSFQYKCYKNGSGSGSTTLEGAMRRGSTN